MAQKVLVIDVKDNVAVSLSDLAAGEVVQVPLGAEVHPVALKDPIPFGHKFALVSIEVGQAVIKYGEIIGEATKRIEPGMHVHTHNLESRRGRKN